MFDENFEDEIVILSNNALKENVVVAIETYREPLDINLELDTYIDYMTLYELFGDQVYLNTAKNILNKLRYYS